MQLITSTNLNYFIIFYQFNSLVSCNIANCENSLFGKTCAESASFSSKNHHGTNKEGNDRNNRARAIIPGKPVTQFFDELLGERLFNTTMNFIVPGAKVHLPRHTEEGSVDHLAMQAFFGLFWAAAWIATIAIPVSHTYFRPFGIGRSHTSDFSGMNFNGKLAEAIGLDWDSCAKKSICQAHEFPEKYGVLGKTVQILFPASDKLNDARMYASPFHKAAYNGAIGQDCGHIYNCFFDILDVILYVKKYCFATFSD